MTEEKSCWICRRTKSEILKQAETDKMSEFIVDLGDKTFFEINGIYGEKKFKKTICPVCYWVFIKMVHQGIKEMIEGDALKLHIDEKYP